MMKAACRGYWDTVRLLLENGAKREATDGVIVLYRRSSHCHTDIKYIHTYIHTRDRLERRLWILLANTTTS